MQKFQPARKEGPFFDLTATADDFESALRCAVRTNPRSMDDLHAAIGRCMKSLRTEGMECEAALITMKASIRDIGVRDRQNGLIEMIHSDHLMDHIVRWCITDFYHQA
jgi:hypothetical protein